MIFDFLFRKRNASTDKGLSAIRDKKIILFGNYPQGAKGEIEKIEWVTLAKKGRGILLVSKYALDYRPFNESSNELNNGMVKISFNDHSKYTDSCWKQSNLCRWLNSSFLDVAFSKEEKEMIIENPETGKVFLLSLNEIAKCLPSKDEKTCAPTEYAIKQGAYNSMHGTCCYWLRSSNGEFAATVFGGGSVTGEPMTGGYPRGGSGLGESEAVRPAIWINSDDNI